MSNFYFKQEQRKYPRLNMSLPIQFREIGEFDKLPCETISKDISKGGVRFIAQKFIPVGNRLVVNIVFEPHTEVVRTIVKIVWIRRERYRDTYELGCQFVHIGEEARDRIYRL